VPLFVVVSEGEDPESAEPLVASQDSEIIRAVGQVLARRLNVTLSAPLRRVPLPTPGPEAS
jgi:hypothetical protein